MPNRDRAAILERDGAAVMPGSNDSKRAGEKAVSSPSDGSRVKPLLGALAVVTLIGVTAYLALRSPSTPVYADPVRKTSGLPSAGGPEPALDPSGSPDPEGSGATAANSGGAPSGARPGRNPFPGALPRATTASAAASVAVAPAPAPTSSVKKTGIDHASPYDQTAKPADKIDKTNPYNR